MCTQSRIVVAENLREEHRYPNLMKIFSAFGRYASMHVFEHKYMPNVVLNT